MDGAGWLFLYTPLPWLVAMYVAAYRHDLVRIARPLRDSATKAEWWEVCKSLGLIDGGVKKPAEGLRSRNWIAPFVTVFIESLWVIIPFPLAWYELCALEAAAAFPLFLALAAAVGPLPHGPYRDSLPYPRLGTRVRHLAKPKPAGRGASGPPAAPPTGEGGVAR